VIHLYKNNKQKCYAMKTLTYTLTIKENKLRLLHSLHVFIILQMQYLPL